MTSHNNGMRRRQCPHCHHELALFHEKGICSICAYGTGRHSDFCTGGVRPTLELGAAMRQLDFRG